RGAAARSAPGGDMSVRVLIVDDNVELAEDLAEILTDAGYEARFTGDTAEAIELAKMERFDVALMDVRMPGMDGVALHARLRELAPRSTFVLMTAYSTDDRIEIARKAGIRCILPKPVPLDRLLAALPSSEPRDRKVLVVEDDETLRETFLEMLRESGYEADGAGCLGRARGMLEAGDYGSAVLDVRLPDGDGAEFAVELVNTRAIGVVLVTGFDLAEVTPLRRGARS